MATKKTASKQSKKVEIDLQFDEKTTKKASKELKRTPFKTLAILLSVLLVFVLVGAIPAYFLTRNDCFEIIGADEQTFTIGTSFRDEGVKIIAFNRDDSKKAKIETNLTINADGSYTSNEVGTFYIKYTIDNLKYGKIFKIQKIRLITYVEPSEDEVPTTASIKGAIYG